MSELSITELTGLIRRSLDDDQRIAKAATAGPWMAEHRIDGTHRVTGGRSPLPGCPSDSRTVCRDGGYPPDWPKEVVNPGADANHIARHDPARVRAEVVAKRQLLDQALAWEHDVHDDSWYTCPAATEERDGGTYAETDGGGDCTCGRDARVLQVLQLLAQPYQETT